VLSGGAKSGYTFTFSPGTGNLSYSVTGVPSTAGVTGQRNFYTDQSGVIRANANGTADSSSTPIS
jgi:hypothetical protein